MAIPLLVEYYDELPDPKGRSSKAWEARFRTALEKFKKKVLKRYTEGTLQRLLDSGSVRTRRAAVLALGLTGSMRASNAAIAGMLDDEDRGVRQIAADALWSIWFRGDTEANNRELQRVVDLHDPRKKRAGLDALIARAAEFAEAYNQRAIVHFQAEEWQQSIVDCEKALKLNPYHFGAAAGIARSYLELGRYRAALKAFRMALRINPNMEEVQDAIRTLENALGEEGRKDDKK